MLYLLNNGGSYSDYGIEFLVESDRVLTDEDWGKAYIQWRYFCEKTQNEAYRAYMEQTGKPVDERSVEEQLLGSWAGPPYYAWLEQHPEHDVNSYYEKFILEALGVRLVEYEELSR